MPLIIARYIGVSKTIQEIMHTDKEAKMEKKLLFASHYTTEIKDQIANESFLCTVSEETDGTADTSLIFETKDDLIAVERGAEEYQRHREQQGGGECLLARGDDRKGGADECGTCVTSGDCNDSHLSGSYGLTALSLHPFWEARQTPLKDPPTEPYNGTVF